MIFDSMLTFDPQGTPIGAGGPSSNTLDMAAFRDMGVGAPLRALVQGDGLAAAAGAATLNVQLQGSVDNATWVTFSETGPLSIAQLNALHAPGNGSRWIFNSNLPGRSPGAALPRFYRLNYAVATGPFTAGSLFAYLGGCDAEEAPDTYPAGYSAPNPFL